MKVNKITFQGISCLPGDLPAKGKKADRQVLVAKK